MINLLNSCEALCGTQTDPALNPLNFAPDQAFHAVTSISTFMHGSANAAYHCEAAGSAKASRSNGQQREKSCSGLTIECTPTTWSQEQPAWDKAFRMFSRVFLVWSTRSSGSV